MRPDLLRMSLCLTVGLVPLVYMHDIYEFALLPKRLALFLGIALMALGWFVRTRRNQAFYLPGSCAAKCLLAYVVVAILTTIPTTHPLNSLVEIAYQIALLNLFVIAAGELDDRDISAMLWTTVVVGGAVGTIGILQYHNLAFTEMPSSGHPSATFGFRNFAAMYLICAIPLVASTTLHAKGVLTSGLAALSTTLMSIYLIYTRTRGAWGGLALSLFITCLAVSIIPNLRRAVWAEIHPLTSRSKNYVLGIALLLFAALSPLSPRFENTGRQRIDEKKLEISAAVSSVFTQGGDRGRTDMWINTLHLIRDHPFGVGAGGWKRHYPPYDRGVMIRENSSPVRPHNDYLWMAAEYGLLGFAIFMGFLYLVFRKAYLLILHNRPQTLVMLSSVMAILAFLGHAFFSFPKEQPQAALFLYLLGGFIIGMGPKRMVRKTWSPCILLLIGLQSTGAAVLTVYNIQFDAHYLQTLVSEDYDDWETVAAETQAGLALGSFRVHLWNIAGRSAERHGNYSQAELAYLKTLEYAPFNWHAHNGLGIVLKRQGKFEEALAHYQEALKYFPGESNSDGVNIRTNLGALYKRMGDLEAAEREYRAILRVRPGNAGANNNMGNIYKARGQLDSARVAYQKALQADSTLVQAHFNLSDLFMKQGRREDALKHAQQAAVLKPQDARTFWNLGRILEANHHIIPALEAYQRSTQMDAAFAQPHFNKANLLFGLKRYAEAKTAYRDFINRWTGEASFVQYATERIRLCEEYHRRQEAFEKP